MPAGAVGLRHWTLVLDDPAEVAAVRERLAAARGARRGAAGTASSRATPGTTRWLHREARDRCDRRHRRRSAGAWPRCSPSAAPRSGWSCATRRARRGSRAPRSPAAPRTPTREAMRRGFEGADTVFLVSAREDRDRVDLHRNAVDAAVAAGVERIVYTSFAGGRPGHRLHVRARPLPHRGAHQADRRSAGRSCATASTSTPCRTSPATDGVIRGPAGDGRMAAVARDDIAASAAAVLTEDGHEGTDLRHDRAARRSRSPRPPSSSSGAAGRP